jgi:hypothetical protein
MKCKGSSSVPSSACIVAEPALLLLALALRALGGAIGNNELARLRVLIDVADGRLSVADATGLIGVGRRQIYRLLQAFRADGADGLISRKRGGPSNRALGSVFRETVLAIVRDSEERRELRRRPLAPTGGPLAATLFDSSWARAAQVYAQDNMY